MRNPQRPDILLAEDNVADVYLVREALRAHSLVVELHVVSDGEAAIRFIEAVEKREIAANLNLALLDVNLPRKTGLQVLTHLRNCVNFQNIPVAMMSSSPRLQQIDYKVDYFFAKPSDYDRFMSLGAIVKDLLKQS